MQKRDLLKIPMPEVELSRIDLAAHRKKYGMHSKPYRVLARIVPGSFGEAESEIVTDTDGNVVENPASKRWDADSSGILVVWILHLDGHPLYTIYVSADSAMWHVWSHVGNKWRTAMLRNLTGYCGYREHEYIYADADSAMLGHYFGSADPDTLRSLDDFQKDSCTYRTKIAILRSRREIDSLMAQVPPLPKDIDRYIDNHVMVKSRYLWYEKNGRQLVGICSHCKKTVRTTKYPSGRLMDREWKCPECGSAVTIKSINRSANIHDEGVFGIIQPVADGIMETVYNVRRWHLREDAKRGKKMFGDSFFPVWRTHIKYGGTVTQYEYTCRHNSLYPTTHKWYVVEGYVSGVNAMIYPNNLKRVLLETPWKYTGLTEFAKSDRKTVIEKYFHMASATPALEKCSKIGMYSLASDIVGAYNSFGARGVLGDKYKDFSSLTEVLGINKDELRMFRRIDITAVELEFYKQRRMLKKPPTERDIRELRAAGIEFGWLTDGYTQYGCRAMRFIHYTTYHKIAKYITTQRNNEYKNSGTYNVAIDWSDYVTECVKLGYDVHDERILMPKNLRAAHGRTAAAVKHEENKTADVLIKKRCEILEAFYNLERDGYVIRMAKDGGELISEGKIQNICVGGYVQKYANGGCTILFLRKSDEPDKPFVTIEVQEFDDHVSDMQIRAYRNGNPDDDTMKWWNAYKRDVLLKLGGEPWLAEHIETEKNSPCV